MSQPPPTIVCVECGGVANLTTFLPPDEPLEDDYPLAYVCRDCNHRHDLIWESEDED